MKVYLDIYYGYNTHLENVPPFDNTVIRLDEDSKGIFYLLALGYFISITVLVYEKLYYKKNNKIEVELEIDENFSKQDL